MNATVAKDVQTDTAALLAKLAQYEAADEARAEADAIRDLEANKLRLAVEARDGVTLPSGRIVKVSDGGKITVHPEGKPGRRTFAQFSIRKEDLVPIAETDWDAIVQFSVDHAAFTMTTAEYKALQ